MVLGIARYIPLPRFEKAYRRLDPGIQDQVDEVIRELKQQQMPRGRQLKKRKGTKNPPIYEVRVSRHFRLTFHLEGDVAVLRNVGPHDQVYGNP